MTAAKSPPLHLELRVLSLEAQIQGIGHPGKHPVGASSKAGPSKSIHRRIGEIQETLERLGAQSEALKTLLRGCAFLSHPPPPSPLSFMSPSLPFSIPLLPLPK